MVDEVYEPLLRICRYINCPEGYLGLVIDDLRQLGVDELISDGGVEFMGVKLLGKGQNSFVFKCRINNEYYACKVRRPDSPRPSLINEGRYLRLTNSVGVGPRLIGYMGNAIVMELISGVSLQHYVEHADPNELRGVVRDLLWHCRRLDAIGLVHNELNRPQEHVIISRGRVYIVDFESASMNSRASNVSQLLNALIMSKGPFQGRVRSMLGIHVHPEQIRASIREYKVVRSDDAFLKILELLGLK